MYLALFSEETPCGSILVNDHSVFAFWVVAYGRFNCSLFVSLVASFAPLLRSGANDATRATMPDKSSARCRVSSRASTFHDIPQNGELARSLSL